MRKFYEGRLFNEMSQKYLTVVRRHQPHRLRQLTYEPAIFQSEVDHFLVPAVARRGPLRVNVAARSHEAADIEGIGGRRPLAPSLFHICKSATALSLSPCPPPSLAARGRAFGGCHPPGRFGATVMSLRLRVETTILALSATKPQYRPDLGASGAGSMRLRRSLSRHHIWSSPLAAARAWCCVPCILCVVQHGSSTPSQASSARRKSGRIFQKDPDSSANSTSQKIYKYL